MKKLFIDTETTGLDPVKNGIVQISGIIEVDDVEEQFNFFVKPFPSDVIDEKAMNVNGIELNDKLKSPSLVYRDFAAILSKYTDKYDKRDKFWFIGFNSGFDEDFMREWFLKNGDKYFYSYFFWPSIDVAKMAALKFLDKRASFPNFKLMTVAASCGLTIEADRLHDSMYDVELTRDLFYVLKGKI